jgi:hypothetical protein
MDHKDIVDSVENDYTMIAKQAQNNFETLVSGIRAGEY